MNSIPLIDFLKNHGTGHYYCPVCSSNERSLSVWETPPHGKRSALCHRATCGARAYNQWGSSPSEAFASPVASPEVLRPYTGDSFPLSQRIIDRFKQKYGFSPPDSIKTVGYTTFLADTPIIIPILAPNGQARGHVFKIGLFPGEQKINKIYKAKHEPMISWTRPVGALYHSRVLLVEDQISALKYTAFTGERACALLGTHLTIDAVAEIQKVSEDITIALDADATAKAFRLARKYGAAFKSCQVKILQRDIKDDTKYNDSWTDGQGC